MQKKHIAWSEQYPFFATDLAESVQEELCRLLYTVSIDTAINPQLYLTEDNTLWIYFEHTCFEAEALFSDYGSALAFISQTYPLSIYGNVHEFEGGELSAKVLDDGRSIQCIKRDVSGRDFDVIADICIVIHFSDSTLARTFYSVFQHIDFHKSYLPIERTPSTEEIFAGCPQYSRDTGFRYLLLSDMPAAFYLESLPVVFKKKLWVLYLQEGVSPVEFDDAFRALQETRISAFSWELSLRLALSEVGISVDYDNGFKILDRDGQRRIFNFNSNCSAEKLFLKLIFPSEPPSNRS